jgi:hypothetical protein
MESFSTSTNVNAPSNNAEISSHVNAEFNDNVICFNVILSPSALAENLPAS